MPSFADNASLVVSELVTNAIKASWLVHSGTVTVWFWADGRELLIEVWDGSSEPPTPVAEPTDEGGRGLGIVAALCESWGYYPDSRRGKVVWALL
jgi:anti-sigma regulatory factor (Ser/Thr protein kinase)